MAAIALLAWSCGPATPYRPPGFTPEELEWERYHDAQREGRLDEAADGFAAMCDREDPYPRACYDRARVLEEAGRLEEAVEAAARFVRDHPRNGLAPSAATRIARIHRDLETPKEGIARLEELAADLEGTDVWDSVVYEVARMFREDGDADGELAALDRIRKKGRWGSQLWDNSIWRMIEILDERGEAERRARLLEEMVGAREESHLIASYESPHFGPAMLELGKHHFERGDLEKARAIFMDLARWKTSRLRDDGRVWVAKVDLRMGEVRRACRNLRKVLDRMPGANTRKEAAALFESSGCR